PTLSEARGHVGALFPTLSISDAERRVYHDRRVSDAPIHSVSSTRCGCHLRLPRLLGRTEARRYSVECQSFMCLSACRTPARSHRGATLLC
ncbi:MAG: hypothetical protein ACI31D_01470, partial [Candidatus Limisoma sp.]